jgi:acetylornithine/succinyldiaminopimelate/putrescine aminotransferase
MPTYARQPVTLVRGEGLRVWDDEGRPYLDLIGGLGALSLGHAHPRWVAAVTGAASTIGLTTNLVTTQRGARRTRRC